jgi:hypothetical protein
MTMDYQQIAAAAFWDLSLQGFSTQALIQRLILILLPA